MKENTVTISLGLYNRLRDFKTKTLSNEYHAILKIVNGYSEETIHFLKESETIEKLKEEIEEVRRANDYYRTLLNKTQYELIELKKINNRNIFTKLFSK